MSDAPTFQPGEREELERWVRAAPARRPSELNQWLRHRAALTDEELRTRAAVARRTGSSELALCESLLAMPYNDRIDFVGVFSTPPPEPIEDK